MTPNEQEKKDMEKLESRPLKTSIKHFLYEKRYHKTIYPNLLNQLVDDIEEYILRIANK